ncbi:DUF4352 domain-containing protein [Streptomyces sp. NPDC058145]|uniref:DUF4352 domain-containing protein n=1 Tax=Streptomyces sp. NPDC058145 TaxID=3346356 RepID=UPI0036ED3983
MHDAPSAPENPGGTMHIRTAALAGSLVIIAAATGCSGGDAKPAPTVTVTKSTTAKPSTDDSQATDGVLEMGTKKNIDDDANDVHLTVQAFEYQQPYKGPQPQKPADFQGGDIWATISIKVCNISGPNINVSPTPWSLAYEDGTSIEATGLSGGDMPKPEFPMDKPVKAGRCAAGLVAYPVPSSKRPERIVYAPDGTDPIEWAVAKS